MKQQREQHYTPAIFLLLLLLPLFTLADTQGDTEMKLIFDTSVSPGTTIELPIMGKDITIDWGDGNVSRPKGTIYAHIPQEHTYGKDGQYTVKIYGGSIYSYGYNPFKAKYADKLIEVVSWGAYRISSLAWAFYNSTNLTAVPSSLPLGVTDLDYMFDRATSFNDDISTWDVSEVLEMDGLFALATSFNIDISGWNISKVTSMHALFAGATSFNADISGWDVSHVTDMSGMFSRATAFNKDISTWDVSKVTDMSWMFKENTTFNIDISKWDVSQVTDMESMFNGATSFNRDISKWNVSKVKKMGDMFRGATAFTADISGWDVSQVEDMTNMFLDNDMPIAVYDKILEKWSQLTLQPGVNFHAGLGTKYTNYAAHDRLSNAPNNWVITDGGLLNGGSLIECSDNLIGRKYWVTKTDQSAYHWAITGGLGTIVSGNGTNEVIINWEQTTGTATLTVTESNQNGCVGIPTNITVNFSDISAMLTGEQQQLCEPKSVEGLQILFAGESPWDFTYSINDTPVTITAYTGKTYPITVDAQQYGTDYIVKLIGVSNATCTGSVKGEVTISVLPKIDTSEIFFEN